MHKTTTPEFQLMYTILLSLMEIQLVVPIFLLIFSTFIFFKLRTRPKSNLPPGPWKLPLIGNIHNLIGSVPHRALHQLSQKHGPLMHLKLGEVSVVVVSTPDAAKQVMKTHDLNFASRPPLLAAEILSYNSTSITFSPYGDYWKQLRKICTMELLSAKRVQLFQALREEVFSDLARWVATKEGTAFNLTEKLFASTYALVVAAALGKVPDGGDRLLGIIDESLKLAGGFDIVDLYPSIRLFRMTSLVGRKLKLLHRDADRIFDDVISEHKLGVKRNTDQEDLVDVLLKYQDKRLEHPLTDDNIKSVIMDVLTAGSETSSTTMDWAIAELLKNPEILKKAQQEVRNVFDNKGSCVDESCFHELKYLKAVIKETLRLHPPVPLLLPKKCGETCEINGYQIPANTKIIVNAWAINRDSEYWNDGECFQPERFLDSQVDFRGNHFEFIPFGAGRRICPGITFGLATVELPLAILLYHFDWSLSVGENHHDMDMADGFGLTARRIKELCVVPVVKRPLPLPIK